MSQIPEDDIEWPAPKVTTLDLHVKCRERIAALQADNERLQQEAADDTLAFNHANEVIGKLQAELDALRQKEKETQAKLTHSALDCLSLDTENTRLNELIERLKAPVSDEEWNRNVSASHSYLQIVNRIIAARVAQGTQEKSWRQK